MHPLEGSQDELSLHRLLRALEGYVGREDAYDAMLGGLSRYGYMLPRGREELRLFVHGALRVELIRRIGRDRGGKLVSALLHAAVESREASVVARLPGVAR